MKILLNKLTQDSDLKEGLQVCYQNTAGEFNKIGTITAIKTIDGVLNYIIEGQPTKFDLDTAMGAYMASELKLIAPEEIDDFETLKKEVATQKAFVPVTERLYYYSLEVLPPKYLKNNTFQMGECYSGDLYYTFGEKNGQYYGCLCNANFSLNNF